MERNPKEGRYIRKAYIFVPVQVVDGSRFSYLRRGLSSHVSLPESWEETGLLRWQGHAR